MYFSKVSLSYRTTSENKKKVKKYISFHKNHKCGILKRKVSLEKYFESNEKREDASVRFASFIVGLDILRSSKECTKIIKNGYICFEISGISKNKELVMVHLREEIINKDRILFLISTFYKK